MIHIIYKGHFPNGMASTVRCQNYIKAFKNEGLKCKVIIPIPLRTYNELPNIEEHSGTYEGIPYQYMTGTNRRNKNWIIRQTIDMIGYIKTLFYILTSVKSNDIIYAWVGGYIWFTLLGIFSKIKSSKILMEINEIPYGPKIMNRRLKLQRKILYRFGFPLYDGFFVISEELKKIAEQYKCSKAQILKVPIIVDTSIADKKYPKTDEIYIFHSGTLYEQKDGVSGMLEAFAIANKELGGKLKYYLTGDLEKSRDKKIIQTVINKYHIQNNVKFLRYLSDEEMHYYQQNASLMIINKLRSEQNRYCFSTKLGEYLSFAHPVILTNVGEAMHYMKNKENAYIVEPNDLEAMANCIIKIIQNKTESDLIGQNGYKLATNIFNYKYQGKRMHEFIKNLI